MDNCKCNLEKVVKKTEQTNKSITIRPVSPKDEMAWKEMWNEYNNFYGAEISEEITTSIWMRILDKYSSIGVLIAENQDGAIGFANYVLHEYTWSTGFACLMDDLFVVSKARGNGTASLLIETLIKMGRESGWTRIYWMTREGNSVARSLYNKFCQNDGFVRYTIALDGIRPSDGNSK